MKPVFLISQSRFLDFHWLTSSVMDRSLMCRTSYLIQVSTPSSFSSSHSDKRQTHSLSTIPFLQLLALRPVKLETASAEESCLRGRCPRMGRILQFGEQRYYTASTLFSVEGMAYSGVWLRVQTIPTGRMRIPLYLRHTADHSCSYYTQTISLAKREWDIIFI